MPSASAKLEKQASTEAVEPIKQGITIIEHKIRNLEKRKARLETYRDQQSSGKELNSDQLGAIAKYDEVMQTLEFARELCKQFHTIATDTARLQKKQARKEALEKTQQELGKLKEILLIQDVLANMGHDSVREDFLAGRNGAVKLTEEDLQHLDDLFTEVSPKREIEEGGASFPEQIQKAAEHLLLLAEGKNKDVIGTTYAQLRQKIHDIHSCGYFESSSSVGVAVAVEGISDAVSAVQAEEEDLEGDDEEPESVPTATFQSSKTLLQAPTAQVIKNESNDQGSTIVIPPQQPVSEVISSVMSVANSSFHFLQDSELDSPDVTLPIAPPASALPIPTQTFTNQNFVPPPQSYQQQQQQQQPPQQVPPPTQPQTQQPPAVYSAMTITGHGQQPSYATFTSATATAPPPQHQAATYQQQQPPAQPIQQQSVVDHVTHWSDATSGSVLDSSDWCDVSTASENARQQKHHQSQSQADSWANETHHGNNDDFVLAGGRGGSSRGRGGGRGGPRGGSRGGNRNSSGGGNYYRNNNNNSGGDNYYQSNGYPKRGGGGGGPGGPRIGSGGPRSDRGGPRGGGNRGGGRGGNRQ